MSHPSKAEALLLLILAAEMQARPPSKIYDRAEADLNQILVVLIEHCLLTSRMTIHQTPPTSSSNSNQQHHPISITTTNSSTLLLQRFSELW